MTSSDSPTLNWILSKTVQDPSRGVLTLVGPTGWGKTYDYKQELAVLGYDPIVICNPAIDLPEEIGGLPRIGTDGRLRYTQPSIVPAKCVKKSGDDWEYVDSKWAIVVDELDKAREDNQSAMLSLFEERRIRHHGLPPSVALVSAMNEPKRKMWAELLSRLLMVPFPLGDMIVTRRPELHKDLWLWEGLYDSPPPPQLPERVRSPRAAHRLAPWIADPEFWTQEHELARTLIVQGLCDRPMAEVILSRFGQHKVTIDPIQWAQTITPRQFLETVIDVTMPLTPQRKHDTIQTVIERVKGDATGEWKRVYDKFASTPAIFEAVGAPEKREQAMKEVRSWLKSA